MDIDPIEVNLNGSGPSKTNQSVSNNLQRSYLNDLAI